MIAMTTHVLALFLLVYVTLDFANPLMPGAVRFDGGSVNVVHADRARPVAPSVSVELVPTSRTIIDHRAEVQASRRPTLLAELRRHAVTRIRSAPLSSSNPAVPSEDH
jgi:hypothetical protein